MIYKKVDEKTTYLGPLKNGLKNLKLFKKI